MSEFWVPAQGEELAPIRYVDCGRMATQKWCGFISVADVLEKGLIDDDRLRDIYQRPEQLGRFYIPVKPNARPRCIDGRSDPEVRSEDYGPQEAGATPVDALAYRLGVARSRLSRGNFVDDALDIMEELERNGIARGAHRDTHNLGSDTDKLGCAAIDALDECPAMMIGSRIEDLNRLTMNIEGDVFDAEHFYAIVGAAAHMNHRREQYFRGRQQIVDLMIASSVSILDDEHTEGLFLVNDVNGTTLDSRVFEQEYGVRAFGYDRWYTRYKASLLIPDRFGAAIDRRRSFVMAREMTTLATMAQITNGDLHMIVRDYPSLAA